MSTNDQDQVEMQYGEGSVSSEMIASDDECTCCPQEEYDG
jgi:hypothetical protein